MDGDITTGRLVLRRMTPAFLAATLARRPRRELEASIGLRVPRDWGKETDLIRLRLADLRADPAYADWSLRVVGLSATGQMVGHAGFHTRPNPAYLAELAPEAVEFGYTVFPPFRRRGYAREAAVGLIRWAYEAHAVRRFVASVSPSNDASRALLAGLGLVRIGSWIDEKDGPEDVLLLEGEALRVVLKDAGPPRSEVK